MDNRKEQLHTWLKHYYPSESFDLTPVVGDASFRRYFRVHSKNTSKIAMDAPPDLERSDNFVAIAQGFKKAGVLVPEIFAVDLQQGFMLLSDFGDVLYQKKLNADNVDILYDCALENLLKIHAIPNIPDFVLPNFNHQMIQIELDNFLHWYLQVHLQLDLSSAEKKMLHHLFALLIESAENQPQVTTHRDYHSRNLMYINDQQVGILDFQDAVRGPVTYDIASLLKDCYIDWPSAWVEKKVLDFKRSLTDAQIIPPCEDAVFLQWFDLMAMQRHLKAIFIFARKFHRDGTPNYLPYIDRALKYLEQVCQKYEFLKPFQLFLHQKILASVVS